MSRENDPSAVDMPNLAMVRWSGETSWFIAEMPVDHEINVDEPEPVGQDRGARPTDLLLSAVASCSGISAESLFRKMRQPVNGIVITATGERQSDWPKAYTVIRLLFEVTARPGFNPDLIHKAVEMAVTRYCPVSATIQSGEGGCRIDHDVVVRVAN